MQTDSGSRMVGRAGELARLLALLDSVAAGEAAVALVSGDAGVGKTRLVTELTARARGRGFVVLAGRCAELGDSVPYLPLADALRSVAGSTDAATVAQLVADRPVLGRLLPDHGPGLDERGQGRELARQQLFGAVLGLLSELAETAPVLLVLEDLHWADRSTRDLLTFLSRVLHRERVAVLGSYRTDDLHRRHPLRPVVAELLRLPNVTPIDLGPLEPTALAEHITALAGERRRRPLDAAELITILDRAEGNAYYAEELLAASAGGDELPAGLAELLMTRVEELSATAQQALRAAAVSGRRVDDELVMAASGLSAPEYEAAIREAVAHQLLAPGGHAGYRFRHALLREAIYADLLPGERTRLHATLAGLLADERRLDAVPGSAAELAHHCLASHDITGAFAASVRAGREAERLAAPAEAHRHYDEALALWERVDEPEKLAGMNRPKLVLKSATNAAASGDIPRAVHQLRRVSRALGEEPPVEPDLVSRIHERLAFYYLQTDAVAEAIDAARTAIDAMPAEPPSWERARARGTYAAVLMATDAEQAQGQAECALAEARAANAPWVEADALVTLGQVSERSGHVEEMFAQFAAAHQQAGQAKVLGVELRAAFHLSRARLEYGDLLEAATVAHEGFSRAEGAGLARAPYGTDLQYLHYLAHYGDGDWDHAQELADGFSIRVTANAEAELSAMALFIDVARGHDAVIAERRRWLEPFWPSAEFAEYTARGLLAEHSLWHGDAETGLAEIGAATAAEADEDEDYGPPVIRLAAIGLGARAVRAARARATGNQLAELAE